MKKLTFVHALVLTPFEEVILGYNRANWDYISRQDYCVHALYCKEKKKLLFLGTNLKTNTEENINSFLLTLSQLGELGSVEKKIIVLDFGEDELDEKIVAKHFR